MQIRLRTISWGLLFIALGVTALLVNLGYLDWTFWQAAWTWWPVLLVVVGLGLVVGQRIPLPLSLLALLVLLVGLSLAGFAPQPAWRLAHWDGMMVARASQSDRHSLPLAEGTVSASYALTIKAARLDLKGGGSQLLVADLEHHGRKPEVEGRNRDGIAEVSVEQDEADGPGEAIDWDVTLTDRVPAALRLRSGAIDGDLDLRKVRLQSFDMEIGAGRLTVTFGRPEERVPVQAKTAASHLVLRIPRGVPVRITSQNLIGGVRGLGDLGLKGEAGRFALDGYDGTGPGLDITITGAVSDIQLEAID